jgi:hypothetical protein
MIDSMLGIEMGFVYRMCIVGIFYSAFIRAFDAGRLLLWDAHKRLMNRTI